MKKKLLIVMALATIGCLASAAMAQDNPMPLNYRFMIVKTVETYRQRIRQKLSLKNGAALASFASQWVLEEAKRS